MALVPIGTPELKSTAASAATLTFTAFTPDVGELLVIKVIGENAGGNAPAVPSGGPTFTAATPIANTVGNCFVGIYTATVVTSSSITLVANAPHTGTTTVVPHWSALLERWPAGSTLGAVRATAQGTGAPSTTITTTGSADAVAWCDGDFAAVNPAGHTYNTTSATPTEDGLDDQHVATAYVAYYAYQQAASAGSQTLGITAPTGQTWTIQGVEIKAPPAAAAQIQQQGRRNRYRRRYSQQTQFSAGTAAADIPEVPKSAVTSPNPRFTGWMRRRRRTVEAPAVTGACNITRAQAPVANANAAAATSIAATFGSNVTAGNLLVAFVAASTNAGTAITFSSTGSPTWVTTSSAFEAGAQLVYAIGYCKNAPSGATTVTATFAGSYTLRSIFIVEYSGADTAAPLDQFTAGKSTAPVTNPTDDAMVTTQNGDLIVALGTYRAATSPASVGAGYTLVGDDSAVAKLFTEEQIQSAAGSIAATFNVTGGSLASGIMSASFKCSGVAATTPPPPDSDSPRPRRPWMWQRRRTAIPPVTVTVGDTPVVPADQRTNVRITWQEHPRTRVASPPLTITITPVVPADSRTNLRVPWSMRGRARHTEVPPAPQVVITSTPVVEQHQAARKRPWFARARRTEVPPPQVVVTVVTPPDVRRPRQVHIQPPRGYQAVPPVTTVVGDTPVIPADGRNNLRIPPYRPRGRRAEPPLTITVTPVVEQRRGASRRPWLPRRSRVATPPLTVTVTQVVEQHRTSARPPWMFRARPRKAEPVQTPTVTVTTTPVIEQHRTSLRIPWLQRHRRFTATPTPSGQAVNTTTPVVEQHRTALRIPWPMRGKPRQSQPVQTPPVVVTVYVPQPLRPRLRFPGRPRAHATQVIITPTPTLPPSAERVQRPGGWLGRRRRAVPPAPITVTVGSTPIAEQPRRLRRPSFFTRRRPTAESQPVPPQVITFTPVVPQSKRPRHWFWRLIHTKGRRSEVVPPQGTIIPLATDRCVKVHGREGSNAVGQEGTNVSHGQESSNVVGREAPRTVFGKRSGNVSGEEDGTKC